MADKGEIRPALAGVLREPVARGILAAGTLVRLVLLALTPGHPYDMLSLEKVGKQLVSNPLNLYDVNADVIPVWPYPPLHGLVALAARGLHNLTDISFEFFVRLPVAAADLAIAILVAAALRASGASLRRQMLALALFAFGPVQIFDSVVHGQIDAAAFLPAVAAVIVFAGDRPRRDLEAGVLLGLAIAIKHPTVVVLIGLLVTVKHWRTAIRLALPAALVPGVITLPFLLAEPEGAMRALRYSGVLGFGGLTLLLNPRLAISRIVSGQPDPGELERALRSGGGVIVVVAVVIVALLLRRANVTSPALAVALVLATALSVMPVSGPWYFYWVMPFLVLADELRWAVAVQAVVAVAMLLLYRNLLAEALPGDVVFTASRGLATMVYAPLMVVAALVCVTFVVTRLWTYRSSLLGHPAT